VAAVVAGYDECVPGKQVNRFCASGLEAVNTAAAHVHAFIFLHWLLPDGLFERLRKAALK
jgi:hypothetical protein